MIDLKSLNEEYKQALLNRKASTEVFEQLIELNKQRKSLMTLAETTKAQQNKLSGEVAVLKRTGKNDEAQKILADLGKLSATVKGYESEAAAMDEKVQSLAMVLPNKPHSSVPVGSSEQDNKIEKTVGEPTKFSFQAKEHTELGENLKIFDFERASKVTGARFVFLRGAAAMLERALIQFMMDMHSRQHGYEEIIPPFIVNSASLMGTGQLPKFKEDLFKLEQTDYYLIPTAEVPVTNFFRDEILKEEDLPKKFCAYSPCFRSEAGSYGKDTRGLIRQHQFDKVELLIFSKPENSYEMLESLTSHAEKVLTELELPFRRMLLCTADMGFGSAKTYDLEVWLPGQNAYREISSCSNFEDFQARRAQIRFKSSGGKPQLVHTLNGSGLAIGRTLVAILENYQQADGSIKIPNALRNYVGGISEIR